MTTPHQIALLVDGDNLRSQSWAALLEAARKHGRVAVARLYTDFQTLNDGGQAARAAGFEPVHVLGKRSSAGFKSMVDTALATDGMAILYDNPTITCLVIGTGDADFIPLLRHWKRRGRHTIVMSSDNRLSSELRRVADELILFGNKRGGGRRQNNRSTTRSRAPSRKDIRARVLDLIGTTRLSDRETNQPIVRLDWLYEELVDKLPGVDEAIADIDAMRDFVQREIDVLEPMDGRARTFLVGKVDETPDDVSSTEEIFEIFAELCRETIPADGSWVRAAAVYNEGKRLLDEGTDLTLPSTRRTGWFRQLLERTPGVQIRDTEGGHMEVARESS